LFALNQIDVPVTFACGDDRLLGIVSRAAHPVSTGVLIVVGGPQYRIGSHRQFALLARRLAAEGFAVMRFDYRGMGDSGGAMRGFEDIDTDIAAAIDAFQAVCPEVRDVALWGLCDAASAALLYWQQRQDARVNGLCLLNPWVRTEASLARTHVRHYYWRRLIQSGFWKKLLRGKIDLAASFRDVLRNLRLSAQQPESGGGQSFQQRMALALSEFPGSVLLILSGEDYTAKEFADCVRTNPAWSGVQERSNLVRHDIAGADHTFSSAIWRRDVERTTIQWLRSLLDKDNIVMRTEFCDGEQRG
jgi:exosortase A-associated hydrolase 1